jgi:signal transduction histidine kinase
MNPIAASLLSPDRSTGESELLRTTLAETRQMLARDLLVPLMFAGSTPQDLALRVSGMLQLLEVTGHDLAREPVDLSVAAERVTSRLRSSDPSHACDIRIQPGLACHVDPALAECLLENLLENAWKFSGQHALPRIWLGQIPAGAGPSRTPSFYVADNGVGFDSAAAPAMFQAFERFHGERAFPGLGLGLAIAQRIVLRHGGHLWVQSTPGNGCMVCFSLPSGQGRSNPLAPRRRQGVSA